MWNLPTFHGYELFLNIGTLQTSMVNASGADNYLLSHVLQNSRLSWFGEILLVKALVGGPVVNMTASDLVFLPYLLKL